MIEPLDVRVELGLVAILLILLAAVKVQQSAEPRHFVFTELGRLVHPDSAMLLAEVGTGADVPLLLVVRGSILLIASDLALRFSFFVRRGAHDEDRIARLVELVFDEGLFEHPDGIRSCAGIEDDGIAHVRLGTNAHGNLNVGIVRIQMKLVYLLVQLSEELFVIYALLNSERRVMFWIGSDHAVEEEGRDEVEDERCDAAKQRR